jgi:filamentous hemagglutinin family protein
MRLPLLPALLWATLLAPAALAQSIIPAADGTGTLVMPDGSTYQITGGTLSGDGVNLFHSFEQFGLTAGEVANFLADPTVQNILGRVVGGDASVINGLVQVSGSGANLYLLNPAGILFGPDSALNLDGSFTATTASGLGFGENWLQAVGETNYAALVGNPNAVVFGSEPGTLINAGNLAVNPGEVIMLASGAVINLGTLNAPGGQIIVLAVPGENRVSIRPEGAILSLELATLPEGTSPTAPLPFSPLDIPSLLRAGQPEVATGLTVNADGTVSLVGSAATLPVTAGTALVSGTLDVAGETGGTVQVLGDRTIVTQGTVDASGTQGGGTVLIGGEYQGQGSTPTASRTYVDANSTLHADALESGNGGRVILWADEGTQFDGTITARGGAAGGDGGFVEVSGRSTLAFNGTVDVSAAQGEFGTLLLDPTNITISAAASSPGVDTGLPDILTAELPGDVTINSATLENQVGNVILEATNNITLGPGVSLTFVPGGSITFTADADGDLAGAFTMDPTQSITAQGNAITNGRDITISGAGVTVGAIDTSLNAIGSTTNGGTIEITSTNGDINTGALSTSINNGAGNSGAISLNVTGTGNITNTSATTFAANGSSGAITFTTGGGDITAGNLTTVSTTAIAGSQAGAVTLTTQAGAIVAGAIDSRADNAGPGGAVTVTSNFGPVTLASVDSTSGSGTAGAVNLRSNDGDLTVSGPINAGTTGAVTLNNDSGGITTADIVARSVQANSFEAEPLSFGNITAADFIFLANRGSTLTTGNLSAGTGNITIATLGTLSTGSLTTTTGNISLSGNDINLAAGPMPNQITTAGGAVAITGDSDGDGNGSVTVEQAITTGGGAITITGASTTGRGVFIDSQGTLNSQGGDISLTGTGLGEGIITFAPITSSGGAISLTGTSTGGDGITLSSLAGSVDSGGGDITMTGTGATAGITVFNGVTVTAGTGDVTLNTDNPNILGAISGSGNLQIQPLTPSLSITLGGTGAPTVTFLNQDEINQLGNGFSSRTVGQAGNTGPVTLAPFTLASPLTLSGGVLTGPSQATTWAIAPDGSLEVGGFGAPLRLLNPTAIIGGAGATNTVLGGNGDDTFTVIGDSTGLFQNVRFSNISAFDGGAGFNTVAGTQADDYFVVTSGTGGYSLDSDFLPDISFTNVGAIATGGGDDFVELAGVPLELAIAGGSGTVLVVSQGAVTLNADVTTPGDLIISASAGDVTQTGGQVTVGGDTGIETSNNVSLGGNNDFNGVTATAGQSISLNDIDDIRLNGLAFADGLQVTAGGDLTALTDIVVGGELPIGNTLAVAASTGSALALGANLATSAPAGVSLTSRGNLTTADITAPGAPITLEARGTITTGNLTSSGGTGGSVNLQSGNRIQVNTINAQGDTSGGAITVLTPLTFQALGSFIDQNGVAASLSTVGGSQGGPILLGYGFSRFTLGDPSTNGTLGAITTGDVTLLPDIANPILGSRIFGRNRPGQVQLISFGDVPIEIEPPPDDIDPVPDPDRDQGTIETDDSVLLTSAGEILGQEQFSEAEDSVNGEFAGYFGDLIKAPRAVSLEQAEDILRDIQAQTGAVPAFLYIRLNRNADTQQPGQGGVELLLITAEGEPSQVTVLNVTAEEVLRTQEQLRRQLTNPSLTNNTAYLTAAQQLYGWLIAPIEANLQAAGVNNIGFIMDAGLRTLPLAALHNGERFLIETYSIGLIPSLGLIDPTYVDLNRQNSSLLVAGASQFINQPPLLAAGLEMGALQSFWDATKVDETSFTVNNLLRDRDQAQIIHLATHAQFLRGAPENSYLQFFDSRLYLNQVSDLNWFAPPVELVTLSACQTAMGNAEAELGFAGFALLAGAKSALASLWKVSDEATAGLMITFYQALDQEAIKAEALRDAQLAMINGQVYTENGQLAWPGGSLPLPLPPDLVVDERQNLSHPFYWAAFTLVGSPW